MALKMYLTHDFRNISPLTYCLAGNILALYFPHYFIPAQGLDLPCMDTPKLVSSTLSNTDGLAGGNGINVLVLSSPNACIGHMGRTVPGLHLAVSIMQCSNHVLLAHTCVRVGSLGVTQSFNHFTSDFG